MNHEEICALRDATREALDRDGCPAVSWAGDARTAPGTSLARYFDHTLLKADSPAQDYETLCREAATLETRTVCVPPDRVAMCAVLLADTPVDVCTVVGFPLGYHSTTAKVAEVESTRINGAREFDVVLPVGQLRDGSMVRVYDDLAAVVAAAAPFPVKVILEMCLLSREEKVRGAAIALHAGAAILKTSTGFSTGGATREDLDILRIIAGEHRGVKASGGIRTLAFARECIAAGVDRIGASATAAIVAEAQAGVSAGTVSLSQEGDTGY